MLPQDLLDILDQKSKFADVVSPDRINISIPENAIWYTELRKLKTPVDFGKYKNAILLSAWITIDYITYQPIILTKWSLNNKSTDVIDDYNRAMSII